MAENQSFSYKTIDYIKLTYLVYTCKRKVKILLVTLLRNNITEISHISILHQLCLYVNFFRSSMLANAENMYCITQCELGHTRKNLINVQLLNI